MPNTKAALRLFETLKASAVAGAKYLSENPDTVIVIITFAIGFVRALSEANKTPRRKA